MKFNEMYIEAIHQMGESKDWGATETGKLHKQLPGLGNVFYP